MKRLLLLSLLLLACNGAPPPGDFITRDEAREMNDQWIGHHEETMHGAPGPTGPTGPTGPPPPPPPPPGGECHHPDWKFISEGACVELAGMTYNTRGRTADLGNGVFWIGQNNATTTQAPEEVWRKGRVDFECNYEEGMMTAAGGGEHFHQIMSLLLDRAGGFRQEAKARHLRFEIDNVGTTPRAVMWFRGGDPRGVNAAQGNLSMSRPPEGQWVSWWIAWDHRGNDLWLQVGYQGSTVWSKTIPDVGTLEQVDPIGRYFFPLGHVDGHPQGKGVEFRNVRWSSP